MTRTLWWRLPAAAALATSGWVHAELYVHGYRAIPLVGPAFLLQAAGAFAVALLLPVTDSPVPRLGAAALAVCSIIGFSLSRSTGIGGFVERGFQPAPQALISVLAEVAVLVLLAVPMLARR